MFLALHALIFPLLSQNYAEKLRLIFRQRIQRWRPYALAHEAGAAVLHVAPEAIWDSGAKLFEEQEEYSDVSVVGEIRNETYRRLAGGGGEGED